MNKKFYAGILTGAAGTLVLALLGTFIFQIRIHAPEYSDSAVESASPARTEESGASVREIEAKVALLEGYIDRYYMGDVKKEDFADGIYKGVVRSLGDPYSVYYTKEEYDSMNESTDGAYCGIGAQVQQNMQTGVITIVKPFQDTPAFEAGLLPGDIIYKVEGEEVTGEDLTEVVSRMKGKEGTQVTLEILRKGETEPRSFTLTRRNVEKATVEYEMLEKEIGYIVISEFDEVTSKQFRKAVDALESKGMKGLVIDLRDNGGGRLTAVVDMLDRLLPEGLIVSVKDKYGESKDYTSSAKEAFEKPMAVLMNGSSASASEVFAGAVQDYRLGPLVGTRSFGKGIVQSVIPLKDGSAVKLTTASYFTPNGRNIHGTGLEPDIEVELPDKVKRKAVISKEEDSQLQKALEAVRNELES